MNQSTFYTPLNASRQEIRLLQLRPGNTDDTIVCDLTIASLQEAPQYEALSYVWGDQKDTLPIEVCNESFSVTTNLEEVLRQLRLPEDVRVLWVDAISINQSDLNERKEQVNLMGQIYRQANRVDAYLGSFHPAFAPFLEKMAGDATLHWEPELEKLGKVTDTNTPMFDFVFEIFKHPWWHRVWTLQEAVLAQRLDFVCGDRAYDLPTMTAFADNFCHHYQNEVCCKYDTRGLMNTLPMNIWARIKYLRTVQRLRASVMEGRNPKFLDVIVSERHRRATDARDHVFGMLGLVPEFHDMVDYSASVSEVFQRAVVQEIRLHGSLDIFSQVIVQDGPSNQPELVEDIPSWVPNWTRDYYPYYLSDVQYRQNLLHLYNASRGESAQIISHESGRLSLTGIICDTISAVGSSLGTSSHPSWQDYIPVEDIDIVYPHMQSNHPYPHAAGGAHTNDRALFRMARGDIVPLAYEKSRINVNITKWGRGHPTENTRVGYSANKELSINVTSNRRIFKTKRGYMGLAPETAEVGDRVCVLFGAKVPHILREERAGEGTTGDAAAKDGGCYVLVGDAYVHGLMDGEALDQVDSGELVRETVVLGGRGL
jgi:hypothetical protein